MLSFALLSASALAACTLPGSVDPNGVCVEDANGFATLDADSDAAIPISITVSTKGETTDAFSVVHGATLGSLADKADGRYVLSCPQEAGKKTVKLSVSRPASLSAFGAEWVQMFPKDSWTNVTNEYEPFSFNSYGAKIPLAEFRPTSDGLADDAATADTLNVFMEVKDEGDFEFKYGNPNLVSGGKWVAVEFKSSILRVGTPWADCSGYALDTPSYSLGSVMPLLFGGPNLNSIALVPGFQSYDAAISELAGVTVDVKVVLEIYNKDKSYYTNAATDSQCYKAGNPCPENHAVCAPEYCEIEVWASIIADLKAASPQVSVLGSIDGSTTTSAYAALAMDGFYFVGTDASPPAVEAGYTGTSVLALGSPLFDAGALDSATVIVTLSGADLGVWNPFSWYPYAPPAKWAAIVTEATDTAAVSALVDRGYGYVYLTSEAGFDTKSSMTSSLLSAIEAVSARRLQEDRRLEATEPFWGCDGTLFECKPVCLKRMGIVTTKVSDKLCAGSPKDQCACKCYHEAQWACEGDAVVCKAKYGAGDLETVGDMVCETRGAPKPTSTAELRVASTCEPITEMRGSAPTAECLAQWETTPAPRAAPKTSREKWEEQEKDAALEEKPLLALDESFAAPALAIAALALFA